MKLRILYGIFSVKGVLGSLASDNSLPNKFELLRLRVECTALLSRSDAACIRFRFLGAPEMAKFCNGLKRV